MAIIIRESKILDGVNYDNIKVFKSDSFPITAEEEREAERLDFYLSNFFAELAREIVENGLMKLKGNKGVLPLWYFVGDKLSFIDDTNIVKPSDKKYIWRALWYHAKDLTPGEAKSRAGTNRDHFLYCYRLAKFEKEFVENAGTWRDWMDFFDSPILSNKVFLKWFENEAVTIKKEKIKNWLREFIKLIRNEFKNVEMSFLSEKEIVSRCEKILNNFTNDET